MTSSTDKSTISGSLTMAELMAKSTAKPIASIKKGDYIKGTLSRIGKREILVDIQAKGQATVLERDPKMLRNIKTLLKEGQEVEVSVLSPESDTGLPVVSLRRFISNIVWAHLEEMKKTQEKVDVIINEVTKGGFVVTTKDGQAGFLPNSHSNSSQGSLTQGKTISVSIADLNREDNKVIFSQKTSISTEDFAAMTVGFKPGTKVKGEISSVTNFGYFVLLHPSTGERTVDGLIHISEVSWDRSDDSLSLYKIGDEVEAVVISIDRDARRIDLSLKKLTADPFDTLKENFPLEKKAEGTVKSVESGNVTLDLGNGVEGIIKKEKVPPATTYAVGQVVGATVIAHDPRRRRIELTPVLKEKPLMYR